MAELFKCASCRQLVDDVFLDENENEVCEKCLNKDLEDEAFGPVYH